jgi:chaperonin GroES
MEVKMAKINIQPIGTRVLIKPLEQESKTSSGLLLPETAKEKPQTGLVVAIGDDEEIKLKVNDKVLFAKYSGTEFKMDGTEYLLLEANDVLAKFLNN